MELIKLLNRCIDGDRVSQKEFYLLTADRLMNICRRYTSNLSDAKDMLQNTYIQIFKNLKKFDPNKGHLDAWLAKIAINEALQLLRKRKTQLIKEAHSAEQFELSATPSILEKLQADDVLQLLHEIPEIYRVVFNLNIVEGFSHQEIAELLDIPIGTSRSHLSRAKKALRTKIEQQRKIKSC